MPCLARLLLQCCRCRSKVRHSKSGLQIPVQSACLVGDCWAILLHARCKASPPNSTPDTFSHVFHEQLCLYQVSQPRMHASKVCARVCFCPASGQLFISYLLSLRCRAKFPLVEFSWPLQASPGKISPWQPGFACQLSKLWRHRHRPRGHSEQAEPTSAHRRKSERQRQRRSSKQVEKS